MFVFFTGCGGGGEDADGGVDGALDGSDDAGREEEDSDSSDGAQDGETTGKTGSDGENGVGKRGRKTGSGLDT